jgi:hypothetical protein
MLGVMLGCAGCSLLGQKGKTEPSKHQTLFFSFFLFYFKFFLYFFCLNSNLLFEFEIGFHIQQVMSTKIEILI